MAFGGEGSSSSQSFQLPPHLQYDDSPRHQQYQQQQQQQQQQQEPPPNLPFDPLTWHPIFQSCHRYFLDHAQHQDGVQALAAFMNIRLPFQKLPPTTMSPLAASRTQPDIPHLRQPNPFSPNNGAPVPHVSLTPYLRRLIATGLDSGPVLHGFFGDDWALGVGPLHEIERRNYLFIAKAGNWSQTKSAYDMGPDETIPFLSPLANATELEIQAAEQTWSKWLAMQDWMIGPREPRVSGEGSSLRVKTSPNVKAEEM